MPFGMCNYIQSVVVQGRLYVGGGFAGLESDNHYIVMEYDISSGEWATLPPYETHFFGMVALSSQLLLISGCDCNYNYKRVLGVWGADDKAWTHPYPEIPTARLSCSAVAYNEWLVVAGGRGRDHNILSSVEVLNTSIKQWYAGPPTPIPWYRMRTAVVNDIGYFMGGSDSTGTGLAVKKLYGICIPTLISHITSKASTGTDGQIWKEMPELQLEWLAPLSIRGSLLAIGGKNKKNEVVTAIHFYQPDVRVWMKVGDLPSPRCVCTCAMISDRELLVAGGVDNNQSLKNANPRVIKRTDNSQWLKRVDLALL